MRASHAAMTNIHGAPGRISLDMQQSAPYIRSNLNMARALATRPAVVSEEVAVSLVGALLLVLLLLVLIRPLGGNAG